MRDLQKVEELINSSNYKEFVVATLLSTTGSTYKKSGAKKVIAPNGKSVGLISGGCLEGEIVQKALEFFENGSPATHFIDTQKEEDRFLGYGVGCRGTLNIGFKKLCLEELRQFLEVLKKDSQITLNIFGAGPDIDPLRELSKTMGWKQKFFTNRSDHYEERISQNWDITLLRDSFDLCLEQGKQAYLLMSHNYEFDLSILEKLLPKEKGYIGILGPKQRKVQLLEDLKTFKGMPISNQFSEALHGPMGIKGMGRGEEAIAISVISEIQSFYFGEKDR